MLIQVGELADQPIQCYRLTGEGAENLQVGDAITVEGILKNYKGTIEFDKGCVLVPVDSVASVKAVIAGYALAEDAAMTSESTITGVIGLSLMPVSKPRSFRPALKKRVFSQRRSIRCGSSRSRSSAARQLAVTEGGCEVENRNGLARWYRNSIRLRLP